MVAATDGAQIWLIGVGLGLLALAAIFVALMHGTSYDREMPADARQRSSAASIALATGAPDH